MNVHTPDDDDKPTMQYVVSHVIVYYVRSVIIIIVNTVWNTNETYRLKGKISAQPHPTLCIQFLNRENNDKNSTFPLGKQICFTIVWSFNFTEEK